MWSVDDGPVFGLSQADCATARLASARGIERGLAPSWPSAAPCANNSIYEVLSLQTHVLKLTEGDHTLNIGVMARGADAVRKWYGGAWIDVDGLLDPTFPRFDDDRASKRHPGCCANSGFVTSCPGGEAFWVHVPLRVAVGNVRLSSRHLRWTGWVRSIHAKLLCQP
jgi:hypothetical protein